ncbi:MAG TPA: glycosyltransferase [Candidatus Saccharimonadales bacterium]|nr:glycosyltransferase [Candidatus Saccharimonadales bacterium]
MFEDITVTPKKFSDYKTIIEPELYDEVIDLAHKLKGRRIVEINATANGGGVAEILRSSIALQRDLGIDAHWYVLSANQAFFEVTKMLHNALQGDKLAPDDQQWDIYQNHNRELADNFLANAWDFVLVHDPQPLAMRQFSSVSKAKWGWRCHIDTSFPNIEVGDRIAGYLNDYEGAIFTLDQFVLPNLKNARPAEHLAIIPPAIDPLSRKNQPMDSAKARALVAGAGIDTKRPYITQISRFDPWKDPIGVIKAWQKAREQIPNLQLVLMGDMADDDPQGAKILVMVKAAAESYSDIHLITENDELLVHALQLTSNVILQKSLREGFGLTVSEALWAATPVIGGDVGGIPLQISDGQTGFLVLDTKTTAQRIVELVNNPTKAKAMGQAGREQVRKHFLLPRLLRDQLAFWLELA